MILDLLQELGDYARLEPSPQLVSAKPELEAGMTEANRPEHPPHAQTPAGHAIEVPDPLPFSRSEVIRVLQRGALRSLSVYDALIEVIGRLHQRRGMARNAVGVTIPITDPEMIV